MVSFTVGSVNLLLQYMSSHHGLKDHSSFNSHKPHFRKPHYLVIYSNVVFPFKTNFVSLGMSQCLSG